MSRRICYTETGQQRHIARSVVRTYCGRKINLLLEPGEAPNDGGAKLCCQCLEWEGFPHGPSSRKTIEAAGL